MSALGKPDQGTCRL